jgi:hypothetical protein
MENVLEFLIVFVQTFSIVIMVISLFGLIVPIFPGLVVIWIAATLNILLFGLNLGGGLTLVLLSVLTIIGVLADNVMMGAKVKEAGAPWSTLALTLLAGVVGSVALTPIGGIAIALGALYLLELRRVGEREKALKTVKALAVGWGWAFAARFGIGVVMLVIYVVWWMSI